MSNQESETSTRYTMNAYRRDFIKGLQPLTECGRRDIRDAFTDAVGAMAAAIERPFSHRPDECEAEYEAILSKYGDRKAAADAMARLFAIVTEALEHHRESFLGPVLEEIGASNTRNGQFLTPNTVARLCADVVAGEKTRDYEPGKLVTCYDSAVGAGVMLIQCGEALVRAGVAQRDIFLVGGDVDKRALDITFVELSLLGYAARVDHQNALTLEVLSRPRWTVGYFLHGTQWRDGSMSPANVGGDEFDKTFKAVAENISNNKPIQMELFK